MIPTSRISARQIEQMPSLVPEHIDRNPWILYHATTSALSLRIEAEGFVAGEQNTHVEVARKLLGIYKSIDWDGISTGGYCVLAAFSFTRNQTSAQRPIYFATDSRRSPLYARPDFAGGETAHAIRHAYRDLLRFVNDDAVRSEHLARRRAECISAVRQSVLPSRVVVPNLEWVREKLGEVTEACERLEALEACGEPGVMYAVEFTPDDLPHITYNWSSGVAVYCAVPADRIRYKVEITDTVEIQAGAPPDRAERELMRRAIPNGFHAQIAAHGGKQITTEAFTNSQIAMRALVDPSGGIDESLGIAEQYGTAAVRLWVSEQKASIAGARPSDR